MNLDVLCDRVSRPTLYHIGAVVCPLLIEFKCPLSEMRPRMASFVLKDYSTYVDHLPSIDVSNPVSKLALGGVLKTCFTSFLSFLHAVKYLPIYDHLGVRWLKGFYVELSGIIDKAFWLRLPNSGKESVPVSGSSSCNVAHDDNVNGIACGEKVNLFEQILDCS